MKKWMTALTIVLGLIGLSACSNGGNGIVAKTESGNVTEDELYEAMKERYGQQTLQQLVFEKVLNDKYELNEDKIEADITQLKEEYGMQFEFFLAQNQLIDEDDLRETLKFNQLLTLAATKDIKVTDDELKEYYDEQEPSRKVRHILVAKADEDKAKEAKKKLDEGADFAEIAKEYSIDQVANENGGEIGFITADQTDVDPDFRDAAFELELNKVSKPIQTTFGWHIIEVIEIEEKEKFDEIKADLELELKESKLDQETIQSTLQTLIKDAKVEIKDEKLEDTFKLFLTSDDESNDKEEKGQEEEEKEEDKK